MKLRITERLGYIFQRTGGRLVEFGKYLNLPPDVQRAVPWFKIQGDKTLRLDYRLDENSLVLDLGGYEGQWASDIFSMYRCRIHVFEPVPAFAENIKRRFALNPRITVHNFGLGCENRDETISLQADASSIFKNCGDSLQIKIVTADEYLRNNDLVFIDLIKINIEGGEYELLENLIQSGYIKNIRDIQVQFHECVQDSEKRMYLIQKQLKKTHYLTYRYPLIWENWSRKL